MLHTQEHAAMAGADTSLLNEANIPPHLLPKARAWFDRQMARYADKHGDHWQEHREWVADYINEELREHLEGRA